MKQGSDAESKDVDWGLREKHRRKNNLGGEEGAQMPMNPAQDPVDTLTDH